MNEDKMTDNELIEAYLQLKPEMKGRSARLLQILADRADLKALLNEGLKAGQGSFSLRRALKTLEEILNHEAAELEASLEDPITGEAPPDFGPDVKPAFSLGQFSIDTSPECQMLHGGAIHGRFDAVEGKAGWREGLSPDGEVGRLIFSSPKIPNRELYLTRDREPWTLTGLNDLRRRLDVNSAIVLCYVFSLFRAHAPQFPAGNVISVVVDLTDVARLAGLPVGNDYERRESRRIVWDALIYGEAARVTGTRPASRYGTDGWVRTLKVPMLSIGTLASDPHPEDVTLFSDADPPRHCRLNCEPEFLAFIQGDLAAYVAGGEFLRVIPARKTPMALARSYALHSLYRWRVYYERGLKSMPPVSMGEVLSQIPPAGDAAITLSRLAEDPKKGPRLVEYHRAALRELANIGLIENHPDAETFALASRLSSLPGSANKALWNHPFPCIMPSLKFSIRLRNRLAEASATLAIEPLKPRGGRPRRIPAST